MLPYAARQLIWMLQSAVQLILAMRKGIIWIMQMIRLFIYVATAWIYFVSTVMWYITSANLIRLVAYRSSETTRRRNVLRMLEEEGVDLGPLLVREHRRVSERVQKGRRSLKDTHMGPGHGPQAPPNNDDAQRLPFATSAASSEGGAPPTRAAIRHRRPNTNGSDVDTQVEQDSLGPAASAPLLRPTKSVGSVTSGARRVGPPPSGGRVYADLVTVERLLNLNPADGSALRSLPYTRKPPTGAAPASASHASGAANNSAHTRRPQPRPRRRPHSTNTSVTLDRLPPAVPFAPNNVGAAREAGSEKAMDIDADVHYYADLPSRCEDQDEDERRTGALSAEAEKALLATLEANGRQSPSSSFGDGVAGGIDEVDRRPTAAQTRQRRRTPRKIGQTMSTRADADGGDGGIEEDDPDVDEGEEGARVSPSPSRPYPPRRVPAGAASAHSGDARSQPRHRPPPPHVDGVTGSAHAPHSADRGPLPGRLSTRSSPRMRMQPPPRHHTASPLPGLEAAAASGTTPKRLSADLDEEDEEDRMNLHNRATVDIVLPVPMDALMKTLEYANRNTTLRRKKFPIVILVTGGVWIIGSHMWGMLLARVLAQRGYVVFCPDYRNFPQTTMEGMVLDVSDAIAWVLNNAERYNGDLEDVTIIGYSCGAHLSMMSLLSQAHLAAVRQTLSHGGQLPTPSEVAYNVPRYHPRRAIHRFVGLSGMYDVEGLESHFSSKGLNSPVLARIAGGRENLARYSLHAYFDPYRRGTTGELLPDTLFDCLPARMVFLHGEHDKVTPASQSASLVGVMRQAQKDDALGRLTRHEEYRRHMRSIQQHTSQPQLQRGDAGECGGVQGSQEGSAYGHHGCGQALGEEKNRSSTYDPVPPHTALDSGDPLPVAPVDTEYILILGAGHTDAVIEECLVGGRSCCVDFLCDYEATSVRTPPSPVRAAAGHQVGIDPSALSPSLAPGRALNSVAGAADQKDAHDHVRAAVAPGSRNSSEGLSGSVLSAAALPQCSRAGVASALSPSCGESHLSVSQCTQGAAPTGAISGSAGSPHAADHHASSASLSALSVPTLNYVGGSRSSRTGSNAARVRTRSPAVPHEVPPDAWLPMSVPREQWPIALRIGSMISPF